MKPGHFQPGNFLILGEEEENTLSQVVEALCASDSEDDGSGKRRFHILSHPSLNAVIEAVEALRSVLFPGYFGRSELGAKSIRYHVGSTLDRVLRILSELEEEGEDRASGKPAASAPPPRSAETGGDTA